jgi:hypothetical protein
VRAAVHAITPTTTTSVQVRRVRARAARRGADEGTP